MALSRRDFETAVTELAGRDPRLEAALLRHGRPPFWHRPPGFATLVLFILEQQVSLASARAAFDRLRSMTGGVGPESVLSLGDDDLRAAGFSRQKAGYARALAGAVLDGFDLEGLDALSDDEVRLALTALPGIGPWTADVYLLSCLRRPDVWPTGDRALQVATAEVLDLDAVPDPPGLGRLGERWRPHRATAARILWHSYLSSRGRV